MGYVALLLGLMLAVVTVAWFNRRSAEVGQLKAEKVRMEEILEECILVRSDLEMMLSEFGRQSAELVKQMEKQSRQSIPQAATAEKPSAVVQTITPSKNTQIVIPERYRGANQMLDRGFEAKEIAENLQIGIGEIQLLLNLKNRVRQEKRTAI